MPITEDGMLKCQLCMKTIYSGDTIMRCLEGVIKNGGDASEIDVTQPVLWFHIDCFYKWRMVN